VERCIYLRIVVLKMCDLNLSKLVHGSVTWHKRSGLIVSFVSGPSVCSGGKRLQRSINRLQPGLSGAKADLFY
jgi:hypothetical protein